MANVLSVTPIVAGIRTTTANVDPVPVVPADPPIAAPITG